MERAVAPVHTMATRTKDSCPAILPIPVAAVMNPAANVGTWQWMVVAAATAMEGGSGKANSNGGETRACVAVDC
jgi:hypothetical protein